jgi:predicted RNA binding protein YcfA (HicA-like mRNA interferase family)
MTTFPSITGSRLIRALRNFGFEVIRVKGSHHFLQHHDGRCTVVPVHTEERALVVGFFLKFYGIAILQRKNYKKRFERTYRW